MEITENIHLLKLDFKINLSPQIQVERFVNTIIIFGQRITLIDTGTKNNYNQIFDYIEKHGRDISDIQTVVLSHSHPDHIGSAAEICRRTKCKIVAHAEEKNWIEDIELQKQERPIPGFYDLVDESVNVDDLIVNDIEIKIEKDLTLRIIHTPGHSKGSISIYIPEKGILFTADAIPVKDDIPNYDNFQEMKNSLSFFIKNRNYSILLSSWTPPIYDKLKIDEILSESEMYIKKLDKTVKSIYTDKENLPLENCRKVIEKLNLPKFYINSIVDNAFKGHLL